MGSWTTPDGNVWAAVADLGRDVYRERFRCLVNIKLILTSKRIIQCCLIQFICHCTTSFYVLFDILLVVDKVRPARRFEQKKGDYVLVVPMFYLKESF